MFLSLSLSVGEFCSFSITVNDAVVNGEKIEHFSSSLSMDFVTLNQTIFDLPPAIVSSFLDSSRYEKS